MKKVIFTFFTIIFLNILFTTTANAVTLSINSFPSTLDSANSYQVEASISGAVNATNYLRIDLYKEGTTNYFGETYNGSDWYSGSDGKSYFPVQIINSTASASLTFQIGNPSITDYSGPGNYKLKIRRYTSSGSASSNDSISPVDIQITYVFPTPTPTPTPTPSPTQNPTETPTQTPTPTKTPTPFASPKPTAQAGTPTPTNSPTEEVLGVTTMFPSATPIKTNEPIKVSQNSFPFFAVGLIILGLGFVGFSISIIMKNVKREGS